MLTFFYCTKLVENVFFEYKTLYSDSSVTLNDLRKMLNLVLSWLCRIWMAM